MNRREYSAGAVKLSFWFMEFKAVVKLLFEGMTFNEIKEKNQKENLFGAPTTLRAGQIFSTVSARIKAMDASFYLVFMESDLATKRKEKLRKLLKECQEYDEKIGHLALSRIELDSDDGVKVNYRKVQTAADGKFYEILADSKNVMQKNNNIV